MCVGVNKMDCDTAGYKQARYDEIANEMKNMLVKVGCEEELDKVLASKKIRAGKGKARNRRYTMRRGPLVVYAEDNGITRAFRAIPGVDLCCVTRLNLLKLAPGGTFGRLIVWTEPAVKKLQALFGSYKSGSQEKKGYHLLRPAMTNTDLARIINSEEIQSVVKPAKEGEKKREMKRNPLKNKNVMAKLNPGANQRRKIRQLCSEKGTKQREQVVAAKRSNAAAAKKHHAASNKFYKDMMGAYETKEEAGEDNED